MRQSTSPSWRRRCLAGGLAAAVAVAGVGVAVAGQGDLADPPTPPLTVAVDEALEDAAAAAAMPVDTSPTTSAQAPAEHLSGAADDDERRGRTVAPVPGPTTTALEGSEASPEPSGSAPSTTYTTIDPSRIFGERQGPGELDADDVEGLADELEAEVRACVADLLDDAQGDFDSEADADRIQSFASDVVDEVLACVAGLVDVGQVLGCVGEVIQEIVAVVMTMDFGDLPELVSEIADDVVECVSA